ncbi:MAG: hypothetical protein ACK5H2_06790 [Beutenbergiaceae bacterium]
MARAWNDIDWAMARPSQNELIDSWSSLQWEFRSLRAPALGCYLDALASTRGNGGYLIGRWNAVEYSEVTQWFTSRNRLDEYELFRTLFVSPAFREHLPELDVPDDLARVPGRLAEQWAGSLKLDGEWAGLLVSGGAYTAFDGSAREAKELATAATDELIGDRFKDFRVDHSNEAWTPWFADIAWDATYVLTDMRNAEVTVLCTTDTD